MTVFTDHKSLESWYKEDLCTMAGPLGRRGRWHEFLSRYNIVAVYKPGADNVIADGLSRWAYPAGVADDTNFHGSDADLEGVMRWEAKEREWELDQLSDTATVDPGANIQAMRAQFAADKRRLQGAQAASSVLCALYVAAWLQKDKHDLSCVSSSPSTDVLLAPVTSAPSCMSLGPDLMSQCSEDEGSVGPVTKTASALQDLLKDYHDSALETSSDHGDESQVFRVCSNATCFCVSGSAQTGGARRRPVHGHQSRQQFARRVLTQGYNRTAHALIAGCTTVKIPPACKVLYSNWHSYYVKDPQYKHHYRAACEEPTKEGYVVQNPESDRPFLRFQGKVCVPAQLVDDVLRAVHSFAHPGVEKSRELFDRRYICHASSTGTRTEWTDRVSKAISPCHVCGATKARRGLHPKACHELPIPSHVFSDVSMDFFDLPPVKHPYSGEMVDYVFTIVDRLTGYVLAIPCRKQGLTSKRVAELFLSRCAFFMGIPDRIMSDNASIINSDFFNTLCMLSGVEMHKSIIYRPQSNGRAERAVQAVQDALRTFLEGRKQSWVTALPLALWGLNDLPGPVSPFSPHRLVFGRDAVGFGDAAPYTDADGCEDAGAFFRRLVQERETVRTKLQAAHDRAYRKFLDKYPEQVFSPGERVWVRNRVESPPLYLKLDRLWQGPAEVLARVSRSTYRVCYNGFEQVLSTERLKPFLRSHDGTQPPLHYYSEKEGLIETAEYQVERVLAHQWRLGRQVRKNPFPAAKPWFRVKYKGYTRPEWRPVNDFMHDIQDEWWQYCDRQRLDVGLKHLRSIRSGMGCASSHTDSQGSVLIDGLSSGDAYHCTWDQQSVCRVAVQQYCAPLPSVFVRSVVTAQGTPWPVPSLLGNTDKLVCRVWELVFGC